MNKKILLVIIFSLTCLIIMLMAIFNLSVKYNSLVINNSLWNNIISNRIKNNNINIKSIEFNDYDLIIDNDNNIYYSVITSNDYYNPFIRYSVKNGYKLVINKTIDGEDLESDNIKIMIYNDYEYKIYSLIVTSYPILNISNYNDSYKLELFDNSINTVNRVLKSDGKLNVINKNDLYSISLTKTSLGNNIRKNYVSIFDQKKNNQYMLKKELSDNENAVKLFINNNYMGIYSLYPKEGRLNNYERNKSNNK